MTIIIRHTILDGNVADTYAEALAYAKFLEQQWLADCADENETVLMDIRVERAEGVSPAPKIYGDLRATLTDEQLVWERWLATLNDEQRARVEGAI